MPTDAGFPILPTATFADVPRPDILCVPGGIGVAIVRDHAPALDQVRQVGTEAQCVTSVCTGAPILGAAGLPQVNNATTHWAWHDSLSLLLYESHPRVPHAVAAGDPHEAPGSAVRAHRPVMAGPRRPER